MSDSHPESSPTYWKRKISAYLHDSPQKVLDIITHEASAKRFEQIFGLHPDEQARKEADFAASAADRLPWPVSKQCRSDFDLRANPCKHPLSGKPLHIDETQNTDWKAEEDAERTMPILEGESNSPEQDRLAFLAIWRFWQNWVSDRSPQIGFYPAETRLPDHTIWNHLAVTSAMQGCYGGSKADWDAQAKQEKKPPPDHPALLVFSIGPVQDFIAAARTTRDLWSGSYLLSHLCATALAKIARDFGPDHVVFPNLKGQPLIDFMLREEWKQCRSSKDSNFWEAFDYQTEEGKNALLTPSLPNRFLALIPAKMTRHPWASAEAYAEDLEKAVRERLKEIGASVADALDGADQELFNRDRFDRQVETLLETHWLIQPFHETPEKTAEAAQALPEDLEKEFQPTAGLKAILDMVATMPDEHRDKRYFQNGDTRRAELNQTAAAWSALYALAGWQLDGVKALRAFNAHSGGTWAKGRAQNKDSLTGKEAACLIAPDNENDCERIRKTYFPEAPQKSIKPNEFLGAATLIKRFWHLTDLCVDREFHPGNFSMPNTHSIADHRPWDRNAEEDDGSEESAKYFAVLTLDGDEMGKWVSGAKLPVIRNLLSPEAAEYFSKPDHDKSGFLDKRRPLSPSFHLQFSEMLGNFALHCARRIVEHFDGRLIYAGGDDVLAMLPADTAIECATALRAAFRGGNELHARCPDLFQEAPEGCIQLRKEAARKRYVDSYPSDADPLVSEPHRFPALVPGPATDVSCGIAIGHIKAPLQDMVKAAQAAEKRAKTKLGRAACAVTIFKRSGEIREWGFRWKDRTYPLYKQLLDALRDERLSSRFPYKLAALLEPYIDSSATNGTDPGFRGAARDIVRHELRHCFTRQENTGKTLADKTLRLLEDYWTDLDQSDGRDLHEQPEAKIRDLLDLLATLSWTFKH